MLTSITPDYEWLKTEMKVGPHIKPTLTLRDKQWVLELVEVWGTVDDAGNHVGSAALDERVIWSTEELKKWNCKRIAWDMWHFKNKRDAAKFITLYNLIWTR